MTAQQLNKLFSDAAADASFQRWSEQRRPWFRLVFACEYGTIWKFTTKEWWQFATKTGRNNGSFDLPLSKAIRVHSRQVVRGSDGKISAVDESIRCVNLLEWTLADWKREVDSSVLLSS